jgi:hypothetical protein
MTSLKSVMSPRDMGPHDSLAITSAHGTGLCPFMDISRQATSSIAVEVLFNKMGGLDFVLIVTVTALHTVTG